MDWTFYGDWFGGLPREKSAEQQSGRPISGVEATWCSMPDAMEHFNEEALSICPSPQGRLSAPTSSMLAIVLTASILTDIQRLSNYPKGIRYPGGA